MYRNQVAGHSPLFWHSGTICKPLVEREYRFYAELEHDTPDFMQFVPKFYGVMDLERLTEEMANSIQQSSGGNGNESDLNDKDNKEEINSNEEEKMKYSNDSNDLNTANNNDTNANTNTVITTNSNNNAAQTSEKAMNHNNRLYNKWSMKCQLRKGYSSRAQIQYIVLEDLSFAYAKPCILDLKIGTRQHSDTESPAKIASKTARCLHTTSSSLGLRLCGMQVYCPSTNSYQFRDKYYGRSLTIETFKESLREFFYDGSQILIEIISAFINRVEKFKKAILTSTKGRKFYSSSLLLIYEGEKDSRIYDNNNYNQINEKALLYRQGSDISNASSNGSMFSPLSSPHEKRTMSAAVATLTHATSVLNLLDSPTKKNNNDNNDSTITKNLSNEDLTSTLSLSSSFPSPNNFVPNVFNNSTPASSPPTLSPSASLSSELSDSSSSQPGIGNIRHSTLPASFSSSMLSTAISNNKTTNNNNNTEENISHHHSASLSSTSSASSSLTSSSSSLSLSSSPYLSSRPIKLYSRKRKTTHAQAMAQARLRGNIDVRIIDFAHTSRITEGIKSTELDQSLLFGFENLIDLLKQIREEAVNEKNSKIHEEGEEDDSQSDEDNDNELINEETKDFQQQSMIEDEINREIKENNNYDNDENLNVIEDENIIESNDEKLMRDF